VEILDALPYGCVCWNDRQEPVFCNAAAVTMFEKADRDSLLAYLLQASKEGNLPCFPALRKAFNEGGGRVETDIYTTGGRRIPVVIHLRRFEHRGRRFVLCNIRDITSRMATADKMRETEERLQILFDATPLSILYIKATETDDDGTITTIIPADCNQEAINMFGYVDKDEFLANIFELMPEFQPSGMQTVSEFMKLVNRAFKEGHADFEWVHRDKSGKDMPFGVTLIRVRHNNEFMLACYSQDLSVVKTAMSKLIEADERTEILLDAMPVCVGMFNRAFECLECNEETVRLFDLTDKDMFKRVFHRLNPEYQPDGRLSVSANMEYMDLAFADGYCRFKWLHKKLDGELVPCDIVLSRVKYRGEYVIASYTRDLREHEAMLREMRRVAVAEESNRLKNKFLANISHEIRTPMNAIMGITEIQLRNEELSPELRDALNRIYSSSNLLLHIVNDILDLSKIEAGKLELMVSPYQTASLINDSVQMNILQYENKPIDFRLTVDEAIPVKLNGDELRIKQILNNLLSNAFKYTDKGQVALNISYVSDEHGGGLTFEVRDTGQGMTKSQVDKLFDEYSRFNTEANRLTIGAGLGMSITHSLVKLMNGEITVESVPGVGSVFVVRLPQRAIGNETLGREIKENLESFRFNNSVTYYKTAQIVRDSMPYGRVLIVDDMESNLYVAKGLLAPYEIQVDTALSGFEAIDRVKGGQVYDIIFMDHMMPRMDGIEATKILRDMGYSRPIVALTANAVMGQAEMFLQNGLDDFISKPVDTRQLNRVLNKLIRDKQPPEVVAMARRKRGRLNPQAHAPLSISPAFAQSFLRDARKTVSVMNEVYAKNEGCTPDDMQSFVIHAHAIKSALANVGEQTLSRYAAILEEWGRAGNKAGVYAEIPGFLSELRACMEKLSPKKEEQTESAGISSDVLDIWKRLRDACFAYEKKAARKIVAQLNGLTKNNKLTEVLDDISKLLLHSAFDEAGEAARAVISQNN
jgi:signal transduction histidine kinase/CheY-like chemotaxis protein/HPt (histidine-containing phosphotransfer) domain-containing protein